MIQNLDNCYTEYDINSKKFLKLSNVFLIHNTNIQTIINKR